MPREWSMEIDYLLDRLDEQARAEFQSRILEDHDVFAKVAEVENELFDSYARGSLPADMRSRFERTLLQQPGADRKLGFARRLAATRSPRPARRNLWLAVAAGVFAMVAGSLYRFGPEQRVTSAGLELRIPAIQRGDDEAPEFEITPGRSHAELVVVVPAGPRPAAGYSAVLTTQREADVEQWTRIQPAGEELRFRVAVEKLRAGAYLLTVRDATGPLAFHEFRVLGPAR